MKNELNKKKDYESPVIRVITVDCNNIIATSDQEEPLYTGELG